MPLNFGDLDPTAIYVGGQAASAVWVGGQKVWPVDGPGGPLFEGEWPGLNGAAWPAAWTTMAQRSATITQNGAGGGVLDGANSSGSAAAAYPTAVSVADVDVLARVTFASASTSTEVCLFTRWDGELQGSGAPASRAYVLAWRPNHADGLGLGRIAITLDSESMTVGNGSFWMRMQSQGDQHRGRLWADGDPEPGTWQVSATDATHAGPEYVGIGIRRLTGNPPPVVVDHFEVNAL